MSLSNITRADLIYIIKDMNISNYKRKKRIEQYLSYTKVDFKRRKKLIFLKVAIKILFRTVALTKVFFTHNNINVFSLLQVYTMKISDKNLSK